MMKDEDGVVMNVKNYVAGVCWTERENEGSRLPVFIGLPSSTIVHITAHPAKSMDSPLASSLRALRSAGPTGLHLIAFYG